ncbi:vacuolar protein sorting-associated protein 13D-like isoform X6 [Penaeus chinensis]|uniref:vacuolar protein sorting-associated protein 13D-like isoform X6 n=1 Tax=Penaeus chinensis TaxID=139456 RepID=UPI001FB602E6|nr:vacuolar protein sorting-associated protein 13D-like isoform X6 [Penaeus chinensis]
MLEGLATWVLNNYLGKYLENLNTDQLSIGLLKGEVELENVPLRKDALRHLDMPVEVRAGFVGKIKLQIPVSRLRSEPWVIIFEQLYLVAGPVKLDEYDEEAEEAASQGRKLAQLDRLEAAWRAEEEAREEASRYANSYSSWLSYGTSFMTNIIENIQLKIQDVHLRYEDDQSIPGQVFACGLTIDSLALQSSDDHWIPRFVYGGNTKMAYKLLELQNMGIYWDTTAEVYSNMSLGELAAHMLSAIGKRDHEYILTPVSATACVKRNLSEAPLRSRSSPRLTCDLKLEKFPLSLIDSQYRQAVKWNKEYDRLEKARHYRKWRPTCTVKENPYDWWQYAIQSHLDKIHRRYAGRNWTAAQQRARDIVTYVNVYSDHLRNPATVLTEHKAHQLKIEQELEFLELQALREMAMEKVAKEQEASRTSASPPPPPMSPMETEEPTSPTQSGEGILHRWFPMWGGWYSSDTEPTSPTTPPEDQQVLEAPEVEPKTSLAIESPQGSKESDKQVSGSLEEEILYVLSDSVENNTFMKRDAVFCQLSFTLKQGIFSLSSKKPPSPGSSTEGKEKMELFELEFANVKMALESRPRSKSYKFDIELGSLNLKDKVTEDSAFPLLVSPQTRDSGSGLKAAMSRTSTMYAKLTTMISPSQNKTEGPLFSLTYESRPFNSRADHRLIVSSTSLDIVYNPSALEVISNFFTTPYQKKEGYGQSAQMTALTTAAKKRYEELKEQTKQELKRNWDQIMDGSLMMRKRWDIKLDISAPQIIMPEHFKDRNAMLVVLDFGKLIFCSAQPLSQTKLNDELDTVSDDEDEFATPCSTPDELETMSLDGTKEGLERKSSLPDKQAMFSESDLHDRIYDRYDLRLCDMQVLVGKVRDNWRFAYLKGTGQMHVLDRFSINLQLERRVVAMPDAQQQWPSATLSGTLPSLVVHVNEQKVQALRTMISQFCSDHVAKPVRVDSTDSDTVTGAMSRSSTLTIDDQTLEDLSKGSSSPTDEGKLLVVQFTVDKMSLELQSRGRSIAELQVTGVRANLNKRPFDSTVTLSVHSLLLVDALQTFGPDFELLVASHKHVSMDSVSGSLLDSEPCSPTSPASPDHNAPFKPTSPVTLSQAISSYAASRALLIPAQSPPQTSRNLSTPPLVSSPSFGGIGSGPQLMENRDAEALITLEVTYVSSECPSQQGAGALLLASVQFNTLDIIANQETVVELVGFVHQLFPHQPASSSSRFHTHMASAAPMSPSATMSPEKEEQGGLSHATSMYYVAPQKSPVRAEVSFDFHKLTVLLLRGVYKDKELVGRKVCTAVLSDAKIQATVENDILTVEGSLGGFQVRDVTPEGNKHQCIISVGQDPIVERSQDLFSRLNSDIYRSYSQSDSAARAFSFTVIRPVAFSSSSTQRYLPSPDDENLTVKLRLASVCYTHSPHFLLELRSCATEFKQYMARVASSIKHAATEMAMGLVSKRIESFVNLSGSAWEASPRHRRRMSVSHSTDTLNLPAPPPASASGSRFSPAHEESTELPFSLNLDVILETPVVVIPESLNSPEVLVAHLGQITVANALPHQSVNQETFLSFPPSKVAEYQVAVRDMSLFSLNVEERLKSRDTTFHGHLPIIAPLSTTLMCAEDLYSCRDHGRPILHSTTIELRVRHELAAALMPDHDSGLYFPNDIFVDLYPAASRDSLQIDGGIVTPLKISVSRQQYRQVMKTLSNLSVEADTQTTDGQTLDSIHEEIPGTVTSESYSQRRESVKRREIEVSSISVKGSFSVPSMCVELRGDVGEKEKPLVNLLLEEIKASYESCEAYKTRTQVTLRSLMMEDLQQLDTNAQHRFLMKSDTLPMQSPDGPAPYGMHLHPGHHPHMHFLKEYHVPEFISTSCPERYPHHPVCFTSSSLPDKLKMEKPFFKAAQKPIPRRHLEKGLSSQSPRTSIKPGGKTSMSPSTPPPSPTPGEGEEETLRPDTTLVTITISTIDKKCPEFHSKYDGTNRFIDVDFNSLNTVINIPSWVMVLDFFSTDQEDGSPSKKDGKVTPDTSLSSSHKGMDELNTIMEVQVRSLTLILNKPECELAQASISQVLVRSVGSEGNLTLTGRLGSLSLVDCTSHGHLYREKFITTGSEAMTFQVFKYGHDDPEMLRECDIRMKLKMSSVMYLHTHRFASELTQFVQEFNQLRDIVSRWRATSAGLKVSDFSRGSRVSLDITAGSPVIFIPMSSRSETLLVAELGSLTITNKFLWAGSKGTISQVQRQSLEEKFVSPYPSGAAGRSRSRSHSRHRDPNLSYLSDSDMEGDLRQQALAVSASHKCLLDVMYIDLVNMDLYTSTRATRSKYSQQKARSKDEAKTTKGNEKEVGGRVTEDSVEWMFRAYCVVRQGKSLLQEKCAIKLQVERNLDTAISHAVPDMSIHGTVKKVHATIHTAEYKFIRGLLMYNFGEPLPSPPPIYLYQTQPQQTWFDLGSVWTSLTIILNLDNVTLELENLEEESVQETKPLACVNFISSRLTFESFSDQTKDVDLVSQEILISDTRFENFPVNKRSNIFTNILQPTPLKSAKNDSQLQAEVHYRSTKDVTRFTILLNNMRLMGILDWWMEVLDFIYKMPDDPVLAGSGTSCSSPGASEHHSYAATPLMFSPIHTPILRSPQGQSPQPQSPQPQSPRSQSPPLGLHREFSHRSATPRLNPMVESTGVMTKHALIQEQHKVPFELKLNITDSELVVLENTAVWDTSAVILRSTAVISYRPQHQERPLSCNLNQCELYSCILGLEDDTALSIIDPVTINIEVNDRLGQNQPVDISNVSMAVQHTVEVVMHQLNIRLSYHDMKMFQQILESIPKQREVARKPSVSREKKQPANFQVSNFFQTAQVDKLSALGFRPADCTRALEECGGRLDDAALWLTHNAQPVPAPTVTIQDQGKTGTINFHAVEIKTGSVNVCVIDDCGDCDVPLLEISLSHLGLKQDWQGKGSASCSLSVDYYNRALSGWEPFLEPWRCEAEWDKTPSRDLTGERLSLSVKTEDTVNVNITNTLLELYHMVKNNWTLDYYNRDRMEIENNIISNEEGSKTLVVSPQGYRRRSPFIPFALKNDTGCNLCFATMTTTPDNLADVESLGQSIMPEVDWISVPAGNTVPFSFEGRGKQRHRDTHELKVHQLLVQVDGWQAVGPVTVDKVGVFFRLAVSQPAGASTHLYELPSARVVVAVTLDGSARKLVTIRSALILANQLHYPVDVKLENVALRLGDVKVLQVAAKSKVPVPLVYAWARIFVRPVTAPGGGWLYCQEPLHWLTLLQPRQEATDLRACPAINTHLPPFRFCVHVKRDNFPVDSSPPSPPTNSPHLTPRHNEWVQPGHTIVLVSPLTLVNLLPYDLHYEVKATGNVSRVKPGEDDCLHSVDPAQSISLSLWTDTLEPCGEITLNPSTSMYVLPFKLQDSLKRILYIHLKVKPQFGGALKVVIYAGYWLINKTGLPLVFKQEGVSADAAGQDMEHEVARCAAPLMFSFTDRDANPMLVARVGRNLHPESRAQFCHKLPLTQGTWVRRLRVSPSDARPDHVYIVGVDVRPGRGRYRDTYMVTFSPRFQIENRSSHELIIAQKCFTTSFTDPGAQSTWLRAIPGCWLPFHWPRPDKDQLLCICLRDVQGCHWSGGFFIEKIDSFYLNIRDGNSHSYFIRVEVIINDATYFIVFTDAESLPPPFRIDNFSEVPITYYQTGTQEERLRTIVKPRSCVAYAWDDVMLPPHLTCVAPGGTSATYNLNILCEGARLTYENFIYIAFTGTFRKRLPLHMACGSSSADGSDVTLDPTDVECQQLVLDVPEGTRVKLARKEVSRTQLWRMTSTGMLQHEGSSPPHDPSSKKSRSNSNILARDSTKNRKSKVQSLVRKVKDLDRRRKLKKRQPYLVLDIAGPAPQPTEYTPLMLRKPDERRSLTQTWRFTEDGRLCCVHVNMYVQAKDGFLGLAPGNDVVLGPPQLVHYGTMENGVPLEQAISRQRLRPGSGVLAVKVDTDGPTRVLQITDVHSKSASMVARTESGDWVSVSEEGGTTTIKKTSAGTQQVKEGSNLQEVHIQLNIRGGLGLSVIQRSPPEELIYAKFTDIVFEYQSSTQHQSVHCSVRDIQVDNQLLNAQCPVVLYVTPQSKMDETRHLPALYLTAHHLASSCSNAYIFKNLMVTLKNLTLTIEEALLFKLFLMAGYDQSDSELEKVEEHQYDMRRMLAAATSVSATRYYFSNLELQLNQVRLSVLTSKKLSPDLQNIKRKMGLTLVRFEHASVNLEPFRRCHPFETSRFLFDCITKHYKEELKSQAMSILGSTDFLGNPFGFFADVSEGVSELVHEGSVGGLVWNVTHGMANSTAKVTGSLSDAVGRVTMDDKHEEHRQRLRNKQTASGAEHIAAGIRGLGLGLYGGLTSIVSQTYTGVTQEGIPGFFSGFAKGMVGTVTKPAIGFLDLASSTSLAVRDTSKNPLQKMPVRTRKPRLVIGLNGMMPRYATNQAIGQELLLSFDNTRQEIFFGYEVLREGEEDLRVLISSEQVRVFSQSEPMLPPTSVLNVCYRDLYQCKPVVLQVEGSSVDHKHYIELTLKAEKSEGIVRASELAYKRPKVRCDSRNIAWKVAQQINYARNLHEELRQTLHSQDEDSVDD